MVSAWQLSLIKSRGGQDTSSRSRWGVLPRSRLAQSGQDHKLNSPLKLQERMARVPGRAGLTQSYVEPTESTSSSRAPGRLPASLSRYVVGKQASNSGIVEKLKGA